MSSVLSNIAVAFASDNFFPCSQAVSDNHLVTVSCAIAVTAQVWEYLKSSLGSRNTVKFLEARDVIFIKNFTVFLLPKPDRKYSHTNRDIFAMTATVEPRFNEVAGDRPNLFVKSRVRYIENLDITNLRGNDQNVRYIEVIVND